MAACEIRAFMGSRRRFAAPHHDGLESARVTNSTRRANHFLFSEVMSSPGIKNISLHNSGNQNYNLTHPGPPEGRFAIVTMRWAGDAMDALASGVFNAGRKRQGVRRSRVVLAPRC